MSVLSYSAEITELDLSFNRILYVENDLNRMLMYVKHLKLAKIYFYLDADDTMETFLRCVLQIRMERVVRATIKMRKMCAVDICGKVARSRTQL